MKQDSCYTRRMTLTQEAHAGRQLTTIDRLTRALAYLRSGQDTAAIGAIAVARRELIPLSVKAY